MAEKEKGLRFFVGALIQKLLAGEDALKLLRPINIHGMELENRIVFPAVVSRLASEDGYVTGALKERVLRIATGGVGLIVLEAAGVMDRKSGTLLKIFDDKFIPGLKELVAEVHQKSKTKLGIQLVHFLKLSRSGYRQTVEELSQDEIKQIIEDFGMAAQRIKKQDLTAWKFIAHTPIPCLLFCP